ncbi:MAG: MFS transporter [Comamonas sp.]
MNRDLWLLTLAQGLFMTNNVTFLAINGLVGLSLAPLGWMATLPVMGYVLGGALSTGLVARSQRLWGRRGAFQSGLLVAVAACLACALAVALQAFWLLVAATVVAGYYSANAGLYRFAATELCAPSYKEKALSLVLAGGLLGAIAGPNLAVYTRELGHAPFLVAYLVLAALAALSVPVLRAIRFAPAPPRSAVAGATGRPLAQIVRQPVFVVAAMGSALGFGIMNLLMTATPIAMQACGFAFDHAALVIEWHVIGMFAPGFFTGHLIARFGARAIMAVGLLLNVACVAVALAGQDLHHFLIALLALGVGWNFLMTGGTTLALQAWRPEEKDKAQGALNFCVFSVTALSAFSAGALATTQGWFWINLGALLPMAAIGIGLVWLKRAG